MSNLSYVSTIEENTHQIAEDVPSYKTLPHNMMPHNKIDHDLLDFIQQSKTGTYVDESTYWNEYYENKDYRYEWNNGFLEIKDMPTLEIGNCSKWFFIILTQYLERHPIAQSIFLLDFGFRINLPGKTVVRKPDCAIILNDNPIQPDNQDRSYEGIYDLCIEFVSDSKPQYVAKDTVERKHEYCQAKVKEYYIIDDKNKHTVFYRLDTNSRYEIINPRNGIIHSTVLPGFQFRIADLYKQPGLNNLINDPVYQSYVRLDLQKERQEKEAALIVAENERFAKEKALTVADKERKEKEKALKIAEKERQEKQAALEEINRLKQLLNV